jgi:hypothetical protein
LRDISTELSDQAFLNGEDLLGRLAFEAENLDSLPT